MLEVLMVLSVSFAIAILFDPYINGNQYYTFTERLQDEYTTLLFCTLCLIGGLIFWLN